MERTGNMPPEREWSVGSVLPRRNLMRVVHCKREPHDVYIGRPSKWGNPFSHLDKSAARFKCLTREEAIARYEEWIFTQPELLGSLHELRGKVLGCWCAPKACHGDVLLRLANDGFDIDRIWTECGFNPCQSCQSPVVLYRDSQVAGMLWDFWCQKCDHRHSVIGAGG